MALKPPFSSLYYCSELGEPKASRGVTPSMVFPTHGYRGVTLLMTCLATPYLGDALFRRRLVLETPYVVALLTSLYGPFVWSHHMLTLALTLTLTLTLVDARGRDGTTYILTITIFNLKKKL